MANPSPAFLHTKCDECDEYIAEGASVFFTDDGKLCDGCAARHGYVCACGQFKKSDYETCYDCKENA